MFFRGLKRQLMEEKRKVKNRDKLILDSQRKIDMLEERCSKLEDKLEEELEENKKYHQTFRTIKYLTDKTTCGNYNDLFELKNKIKRELSALESDNSIH